MRRRILLAMVSSRARHRGRVGCSARGVRPLGGAARRRGPRARRPTPSASPSPTASTRGSAAAGAAPTLRRRGPVPRHHRPGGTVTTAGTRPADDSTVADIDAADGSHIRLYVPDGDVDRREEPRAAHRRRPRRRRRYAAAVAIGVVLSRRLVRPLDTLAATARRLGDGDFAARTQPTGVAEVDAVGATLDDGARRIGARTKCRRGPQGGCAGRARA